MDLPPLAMHLFMDSFAHLENMLRVFHATAFTRAGIIEFLAGMEIHREPTHSLNISLGSNILCPPSFCPLPRTLWSGAGTEENLGPLCTETPQP